MRTVTLLLSICFVFISFVTLSQAAYNTTPDWNSQPMDDVSTGLALADINGDGYKDMVIANGNDISRQHLVVYYNDGEGNFEDTPDWESDDIDYHGHISCGDIDNDGNIDVAVSVYIGESGFDQPGELKVYYNTGSELEASPSFVSEPFYTFSCALGDADGDGDLDLASVGGEPYNDILDKGRVYYNVDGSFSEDNMWQSDIDMGALDVAFGDFDLNGFLDLVFVCEGTPNYIYLADDNGSISTEPAWQSTDEENYVNSVEVGYSTINEDPLPYIVMTENDQLGGQGRVKRYDFDSIPEESGPAWTSESFGTGSGIKLGWSYEEENSFIKTLFYGGWWLPIEARLVEEGGFADPYFSTSTSSVVEAIETSDLDQSMISSQTLTYTNQQDYPISAIQIYNPNVEAVESVTHSGSGEEVAFSYVHGESWVSLHEPLQPGNTVEINYQSSPAPDMVVSNWDNVGNYIFYNTYLATNTSSNQRKKPFKVYPNPAGEKLTIQFEEKGDYSITIHNNQGKLVATEKITNTSKCIVNLNSVKETHGVFLLSARNQEGQKHHKKIVLK